ncbi:unnamed protein product, partial [Musa hybrid cultivar]
EIAVRQETKRRPVSFGFLPAAIDAKKESPSTKNKRRPVSFGFLLQRWTPRSSFSLSPSSIPKLFRILRGVGLPMRLHSLAKIEQTTARFFGFLLQRCTPRSSFSEA